MQIKWGFVFSIRDVSCIVQKCRERYHTRNMILGEVLRTNFISQLLRQEIWSVLLWTCITWVPERNRLTATNQRCWDQLNNNVVLTTIFVKQEWDKKGAEMRRPFECFGKWCWSQFILVGTYNKVCTLIIQWCLWSILVSTLILWCRHNTEEDKDPSILYL